MLEISDLRKRGIVTAKLICAFVFAQAKIQFSHDAAHMLILHVKTCFFAVVFIKAKPKVQISCAVYCTADQHLCFCYIDATIPLQPKSKISCFCLFVKPQQPSLSRTRSETLKRLSDVTGTLSEKVNCLQTS